MFALIAYAIVVMLCIVMSYARTQYPGQYAQYSDQERAWFKGVHTKRGVSCCDIADGHKTTWKHGESETGYMVAVDNPDEPDGTGMSWLPVPNAALITETSDPEGDTVVWYTDNGGYTDHLGNHHTFFIRCFVPGRGV